MTNAKYPWVRYRVNTFSSLIAVPHGWTLDCRDASDDVPAQPPRRFVDGQTATVPPGLWDIRLMPGVRKGAVDYWERWFQRDKAQSSEGTKTK